MRPALITGGAGFIGTNLAHRFLSSGRPVIVLDNLSRRGVEQNLEWLRATHGDRVQVQVADVRDPQALRDSVGQAEMVFHFAAQVAVTTSLDDPITDFDVNARGALNVLEAIRELQERPPILFTSTNKVYGGLEDLCFRKGDTRYQPEDPAVRARGIAEDRPLDFHSPYGCSKGAADQYVLDYSRTMGITGVVFRMSCIYGPHQFGNEDQGWVAHFLIQAMKGEKITLYGDGKQVRDVLFVEDLVDAFLLAMEGAGRFRGQAFNMGGGPENTISLLELLELIQGLHGRKPEVEFMDWRPGDQRYYVSDFSKFRKATGWSPRRSPQQGVHELYDWLEQNRMEMPAPSLGKAVAL